MSRARPEIPLTTTEQMDLLSTGFIQQVQADKVKQNLESAEVHVSKSHLKSAAREQLNARARP